jgi:hypothetical protein
VEFELWLTGASLVPEFNILPFFRSVNDKKPQTCVDERNVDFFYLNISETSFYTCVEDGIFNVLRGFVATFCQCIRDKF